MMMLITFLLVCAGIHEAVDAAFYRLYKDF
jgi:hypothetical protein